MAERPRLLADENFNNDIVRALLRHLPELDIVRAQDTSVAGADDPTLLDWAAEQGRILLTHDVRTIPAFAYARVRAGQAMPGVIEVASSASIATVLSDLLLLIAATRDDEWANQAQFIPLG